MKFLAQIISGSTLDRAWRAQGRLSGELSGVIFRRSARGGFESEGEISEAAIMELSRNASIQISLLGKSTLAPVAESKSFEPPPTPAVAPAQTSAPEAISAPPAAADPVPAATP